MLIRPDAVWKALAHPTRRRILDLVGGGPRTTGDLVRHFPRLSRIAVMKHRDVLVAARLVLVRREGRLRWNHLNPAPIQRVCERWVSGHTAMLVSAALDLKQHVEHKKKRSFKEKSHA
jgi:DNA-binding transcriptional ArsR family regulator